MKTQIRRAVGRRVLRVLRRWAESEQPKKILWDDATPLPPGADEDLRVDHPRLLALRDAYASLDWPVCQRGRWTDTLIHPWLDVRYFRGDNPYVWQYREQDERASKLKFFVYLRYVLERDERELVRTLGEDGAFGAWTYRFEGYPPSSRDLLDSTNELYFLEKHLSLSSAPLRILDVGAGYGRLAHRVTQFAPNVTDYCCVDAIPESTYLCEYYLRYRNIVPPARVVPLPDVPSIEGPFDVAFNVHSFSECPLAAIEWWLGQLTRLRVPKLFLVPNEAEGFLTTESDRSRQDYGAAIAAAGYELVATERKYTDPAVRDLIDVHDRYCLFELRT